MRNAAFQSLLAGACLAVLAASVVMMAPGANRAEAAAPRAGATITCADARYPAVNVPVPNVIDATCAVIPTDMNGTFDIQPPADIYSWLTFVAVNWPVDATTCTPSRSKSILTAPPAPTWLTYLTSDDVFVSTGSPLPWCAGPKLQRLGSRRSGVSHLPSAVRSLAGRYFASHPAGTLLFLHHYSKSHALVEALHLEARLGLRRTALHARADGISPAILNEILDATNQPVVDQNGRFERFTVSMNFDEYTYIKHNRLWTLTGENNTGNLNFPVAGQNGATVGAMELKAGWKVLTPGKDIASHFFTMPAIVYNDQAGTGPPQLVTVGLVGLHIIHKTPRQRDWTWSTFEQIDNTNDGPNDGNPKSFYNPSCSPASCPPNVQTAPTPYIEIRSGGKRNPPTQVVAVVTPTPTVVKLNANFRGMLKNTVWSYYQLISTQWTGGSGPAPTPNPAHLGHVQPFVLGNPVLETYVPPSPSPSMSSIYSCIYCHSLMMQNYNGHGFTSDFSLMVTPTQR